MDVQWCEKMAVCVDIHVGLCFSFQPIHMWNVGLGIEFSSQMNGTVGWINIYKSDFIPGEPV